MVNIAALAAMGLIAGLLLLWWGGDMTVRYAAQTAYLFRLSGFFIGFFVASLSTGIPELSIAISSIWYGAQGLSVGDIIGSNFVNITLVLGLPAFFAGAVAVPATEKRDILLSLAATCVLVALVFLTPLLYRWHGIVLLVLYGIVMAYFWQKRHAQEVAEDQEALSQREVEEAVHLTGKLGTIIKLLIGMSLVLFAAQLCVQSAMVLARQFNISLEVIGATTIAVGTSVPELVLNMIAIRRRQYSMALGNVIGSILLNISLILGFLAVASSTPLQIVPARHIAPFMLVSYIILGYAIWRRDKVNRLVGAVLIVVYASFLVYEIMGIMQ